MRHALILALLLTTASPAASQEEEAERGLSLMERGAQLFMEGIMRELEPALEGLGDVGPALQDFAEEMGPALGDILTKIEDWSRYHPPEILPNGDIIMRRKPDPAPEELPGENSDDGAVDI